jgi:hypothetical protein
LEENAGRRRGKESRGGGGSEGRQRTMKLGWLAKGLLAARVILEGGEERKWREVMGDELGVVGGKSSQREKKVEEGV